MFQVSLVNSEFSDEDGNVSTGSDRQASNTKTVVWVSLARYAHTRQSITTKPRLLSTDKPAKSTFFFRY